MWHISWFKFKPSFKLGLTKKSKFILFIIINLVALIILGESLALFYYEKKKRK